MLAERLPESDERDDRSLLSAVAEGDRGALRTLFDRHQPWLAARVAQRCDDPQVVAEVVNDTFLTVWQKPRAFRGEGEVAAWLWGIGVRHLLHRVRPRKPVLEKLVRFRQVDEIASAEELVLLRLEHTDAGDALRRLPPELQSVVRATVLDGLSTTEAGRLLGIPSGTVKSRMSRARQLMREALT